MRKRRIRTSALHAREVIAGGGFPEETLLSDELDLSVDPGESDFGVETFEQIVFGDDTYNALCEAVRGRRIWDLPEDYQ